MASGNTKGDKTASPKVSMISLGCPRTLVDSELHLGRLKKAGYSIVDEADGSDVVIINTCSFIQESTQESIDTVLQAVELKRQGRVKAVVVAGCLVQRFKQDLIKELPDVDGFVGVDGFGEIDTVVERALKGKQTELLRQRPDVLGWGSDFAREPLAPPHYAYLKISEGCLQGCSFCVIPKIKGPMVSRSIEAIVAEAAQLVRERGTRELIIVGQDTSDYGVDIYGRQRMADLLRALGEVEGLEWVRLLYCHPRGITDELIEAIREVPIVCKYLDMAIEHADDYVLKRMNRHTTQDYLRERIQKLRERVPGITLRTSIIVGFPGETEERFENMLRFLNDIRFERLGAFIYSPEQDSAAARFPDQVSDSEKHARFNRLMIAQQGIASEINEQWLGQTCEVIIDERDAENEGQYLGRTRADCPEVDGIVYVKSTRPLQIGEIVRVQIEDSLEYDLIGSTVI